MPFLPPLFKLAWRNEYLEEGRAYRFYEGRFSISVIFSSLGSVYLRFETGISLFSNI
jgi:hypothetical protein